MVLTDFSDDYYKIEHLTHDTDVSEFSSRKGAGLEAYIKYLAWEEERENLSRTYIVRDAETEQIAAYFTLRSGLIVQKRPGSSHMVGSERVPFDTYTGIELSNFAVNDSYREIHPDMIPKFGSYVFNQFILPLTKEVSNYIGAAFLYIYSLPNNNLMAHYKTMGFSSVPREMERFIYSHVKPYYDEGCIFMWQRL